MQAKTFQMSRRTYEFLSTLNELLGKPDREWVRIIIRGDYQRKYVGKIWECGCRVNLSLGTVGFVCTELIQCLQHKTLIDERLVSKPTEHHP
jgi:hypothetical protein